MDTITFLIVVSDSKISVASATLALIWRSRIDLSLVSPFPSTTTANSIPSSYGPGDMHAFSSHGYYCVVRRHEFISLPFQRISSGTSPEYVLVDQPCFFEEAPSTPSVLFSQNFFSFFFIFSIFFSVKMWFDVTLSIAEGTSWRWAGFADGSWSDLNL